MSVAMHTHILPPSLFSLSLPPCTHTFSHHHCSLSLSLHAHTHSPTITVLSLSPSMHTHILPPSLFSLSLSPSMHTHILPPSLLLPTHPHRIPLKLTWGKTISINVHWFQYESDPDRNSNVYEVAQKAVTDHFPGEFGSERLIQQVSRRALSWLAGGGGG